jgi:hypothetical protein
MTNDGGSDFAISIVKVACLLMIGVMVISGIGVAMTSGGGGEITTVTMETNPSDGDTFTVGDTTPMVFEFNNTGTVGEGNWAVTINNSSVADTRANFVASLEANTGYIITTDGNDIIIDGSANAETTATNITVVSTTSMGVQLYNNVADSITSGYGLAALMVLALGAAGIMRYLGFM